LLRQVHPHSRNMASRHGASVVAAAPPQKRRTGVVDAACGLRLRVANERRECPIRPATQEQVDVVGENRLGEHVDASALCRTVNCFRDDLHVPTTD